LSNHRTSFTPSINAGHFVFINRRAETLLGYEPSELIGKHYSVIVHPDDISHANYTFQRTTYWRSRIEQCRDTPEKQKSEQGIPPFRQPRHRHHP
jgi:PAS domain S-box-containing protein